MYGFLKIVFMNLKVVIKKKNVIHKKTKQNKTKTTLRFHFSPVRMAIIKNTTTNKCWQGCGEKEPSITAGGNVS
jgi:hypothetical protein